MQHAEFTFAERMYHYGLDHGILASGVFMGEHTFVEDLEPEECNPFLDPDTNLNGDWDWYDGLYRLDQLYEVPRCAFCHSQTYRLFESYDPPEPAAVCFSCHELERKRARWDAQEELAQVLDWEASLASQRAASTALHDVLVAERFLAK